jgi:predicted phosphodiesterase
MLYGIFSDIHGNLPALDAVLASMESRKVERLICLGDLVGYGPHPNECVAKVKSVADHCIIGNHDSVALKRETPLSFNVYARAAIEWTQGVLTPDSIDYLKALPYIAELGRSTFVHASPMSPADWHYVADLDDAIEGFEYFQTQFCFIGHTHSPVMVAIQNGSPDIPAVIEGPVYRPEANEKLLVNVGSVGQPRDRDPRASWCLMDSDGGWLEIVRVEYDYTITQKAMRDLNFATFLVERLAVGR